MNIPADLKKEVLQLYQDMDRTYDRVAGQTGFECRGCEDNCCRTLFYHHTLMELLYLKSGLAALPLEIRDRIAHQAREVVREAEYMAHCGETVRLMCPLNEQGRCALYAYRPMICRLHGLPHSLHRPDGRVVDGPGCDAYYAQCGKAGNGCLDRTPLYTAVAGLERRLRQRLGFNQKIRLTIAQMISNYEIY